MRYVTPNPASSDVSAMLSDLSNYHESNVGGVAMRIEQDPARSRSGYDTFRLFVNDKLVSTQQFRPSGDRTHPFGGANSVAEAYFRRALDERDQTWVVPNRSATICTPCGPVEAEFLPNRSRIPLDELERTHRHVRDARKIRENFRDEEAEYAELVQWDWPTEMQMIGTCESVMYASDKWQKRRGDLIDYKHIAESSQRLYVCKGLMREYDPPYSPMKLDGPMVKVDRTMPDTFAVLAEILAVQCRLFERRGRELHKPRGDAGLFQIDLPKAMLGAAVHPGTGRVFLVVYTGDKVLCMINGVSLNVEKDGIVG